MSVEPEYKELNLIIGEGIPEDVPALFNTILLYLKDENGEPKLYSKFVLPYLINYSEFMDIPGDPRYFFYEGYDKQYNSCRYRCMVQPLGESAGIYRIMNDGPKKIRPITPIVEAPTEEPSAPQR